MLAAPRRLGISLMFTPLLLIACSSGSTDVAATSSTATSMSVAPSLEPRPDERALLVSVKAGGDCRALYEDYEIRVPSGSRTKAVGEPTEPVVEVSEIVPCLGRFWVKDLPDAKLYQLVDKTRGVAWGPWTGRQLERWDWEVEVSVVDLD